MDEYFRKDAVIDIEFTDGECGEYRHMKRDDRGLLAQRGISGPIIFVPWSSILSVRFVGRGDKPQP